MFWSKKVTYPNCSGNGYTVCTDDIGSKHTFKRGCRRCGGRGNTLSKFHASRMVCYEPGGYKRGSGRILKDSENKLPKILHKVFLVT